MQMCKYANVQMREREKSSRRWKVRKREKLLAAFHYSQKKICVLVSLWQKPKPNMCLFDEDDLRKWICDEEIFSRFKLSNKERQILIGHVVKGLTFKVIGKLLNVTRQRAQQVYARSIKKIKRQIFEMLKEM